MFELRLPHLLGLREEAGQLVAEAGFPDVIGGDCVVLADDLATGSASAADELVNQIVQIRSADHMILVSAPRTFEQRIRAAAEERNLADRVIYRHAAGMTSRL